MDEEKALRRVKDGFHEDFEIIVDLYKNRVFSMAYSYTKDYVEAQDLAQEIFIKVFKGINNFRFDSKFSTWLYRVAVNLCIDWAKKKRLKIVDDSEKLLAKVIDNKNLPQECILENEQKQDVHKAISELPEIYKSVIILYHFNNISYNQISTILDIPVKTVETRLYRARRKLKEILYSKSKSKDGGDCFEM
ncbi:RNA polymerase sigma factor [Abyssisolibacter fermentans]|uniref:RNA polymerase sigma factor n=1 Tax=Abyssisolibacter fermentans TaxID=1766203 RepID=UPI000831AACE|nr:sigma-70 family RNA polymerase sigma factor [Abyssisolibacter fermentans]